MSFVRERKTSRQIVLRFGNFPTKLKRPLGSASYQSHVIVRRRNAFSFYVIKKTARRSIEDTCLLPRFTVQRFSPYVCCRDRTLHLSPDSCASTLQFRSMMDLPSRNWLVLLLHSEFPVHRSFLMESERTLILERATVTC